jgi:hypothetical protein
VFLTGRPQRLRRDTAAWLDRHGLGRHRLVMRPEGDRRPAVNVKVELIAGLAQGRTVAVVVDDDPVVVAALDTAGYRTIHAGWETRSAESEATLLTAQEVDGRT